MKVGGKAPMPPSSLGTPERTRGDPHGGGKRRKASESERYRGRRESGKTSSSMENGAAFSTQASL